MKRNDGGPAFPLNVLDQSDSGNLISTEANRGMSLRDYFAAHALVIVAALGTAKVELMAKQAYEIADFMIDEGAES